MEIKKVWSVNCLLHWKTKWKTFLYLLQYTMDSPSFKPWPNPLLTPLNPQSNRKAIHTDRYLNYNSSHPISAKLFGIHTLIHKTKQVCSKPKLLAKEMDLLHKVIQDNHCLAQFFQQGKPRQKINKKPNTSTEKFIEGTSVVKPYIKGLSKRYRHTLSKYIS